jgi:transcriptional regulator with XRE-family HTH domain
VDNRKTSAVDLHVGGRVRTARIARRVFQQALGQAVGVTFQQIQKYEKRANRIGTGRLHAIAKSLQVPVTFFFDGVDRRRGKEPASLAAIGEAVSTREGVRIAIALARLRNPQVRRHVASLLEAIIASENEDARSPMSV